MSSERKAVSAALDRDSDFEDMAVDDAEDEDDMVVVY